MSPATFPLHSPDDEPKEQVRSRINIVSLVERYVKLKPAGRNMKGICPFHKEKTPSFIVTPDRGTFHCFGCGKGGDVFTFLQEIEGIDFREALVQLAEEAGVTLRSSAPQQREQRPGPKVPRSEMIRAHQLAVEFYYGQVKGNERAVAYFKERGLKPETVREFRLGFAPPEWSCLVEHLAGHGFDGPTLVACGLAIEKTPGSKPYDRFRNRIMFPLFDPSGRPVALAGRGLDADSQPKYLNSPETPIYRKSRYLYGLHRALPHIKEQNRVIVVEGYMDYLALVEAGIGAVAATSGTAFTADHAQMIRRYTSRAYLVFDGDAAGVSAAARAIPVLAPVSLDVRVLILRDNHDPDSFVRSEGPEAFLALLDTADEGFTFLLERAVQTHGVDSPHAKSAVVRELVSYLNEVADAIVRADHVKRLAERLGVGEHLVRQELRPEPSQRSVSAQSASHPKGPRYGSTVEGHFMMLLISHPELIAEAREYVKPETITDPFSNVLYSTILRAYERDPGLGSLLDETAEEREKQAVAELSASVVPVASPGEELAHTVVELQKKFIRHRLREITRRLRDNPRDRALLQEQHDMSRKLHDLTMGQ